jgi:predicted nucleotide-binding protein
MNLIKQLQLHVIALSTAVEQDTKFFASIIHYVQRFKKMLTPPSTDLSQEELQLLARKIEEFYQQWRPTGQGLYIPPRQTDDTDKTVRDINQLIADIAKMDEAEFKSLLSEASPAKPGKGKVPYQQPESPCVFIGHGQSKLWARLKVFLQDDLGIATVTYESEPRSGESIVPVLEKMLDQATFAVLILTTEDEAADGTRRARQNVVHEAGLFQGRLGFKKGILLVQEGLEEFSNVAGLQYIPFTGDRIEQAFYELQRVLKREHQIL